MKTVVFDLDGTLLDTLQSLANCYNRVLSAHDLQTHEVAAYRNFIGNGARNCLLACLRASGELTDLTDDHIDQLLDAQQQDYRQSWHQDVAIYPGIQDAIADLQRRGMNLAVLTNKDHEFAERCIRHFFPNQPFAYIQGFTAQVPHKPDPIGAQRIAEYFSCSAEETCLVGDTWVDVATAKRAGFKAIGVLWGFRGRSELVDAGADHIISTPADLADVVG
ncbi:MAG: HAD family hydrolase [Pseudomonadales bacterium]